MTESITGLDHAPTSEVQPPVTTHETTLEQNVPVSVSPTRDIVGPPIFVLPGEEQLSAGMLRLAEVVGPMRWNALVMQAKSDKTPEERAAFVGALRSTPALGERPVSEWNKGDWRISRHYTDRAFVMAETGYGRGGMRNAQASFAQSLDRFTLGFPEGEGDMRDLFGAIYELGTSGDWEEKPNLAREVANTYWDVGERVLESWTVQPVRQN